MVDPIGEYPARALVVQGRVNPGLGPRDDDLWSNPCMAVSTGVGSCTSYVRIKWNNLPREARCRLCYRVQKVTGSFSFVRLLLIAHMHGQNSGRASRDRQLLRLLS